MKKTLIAAAVSMGTSHAAKAYLTALSKLKGDFDVLLVDFSSKPVYAEWLSKKQDIIRLKVMRKEFPEGTETWEKRAACHNIIRNYCLDKKYEDLLLLEHNVIIPEDGLKRLKASGKDVISGITYDLFMINNEMVRMSSLHGMYDEKRQQYIKQHKEEMRKNNPRLYAVLEKKDWDFNDVKRPLMDDEVEKGKGIIPVKFASFDCLYISRYVLEQMKFSSENGSKSDDVVFFIALLGKKIPAFADTDVQCGKKIPKELMERLQERMRQGPASAG